MFASLGHEPVADRAAPAAHIGEGERIDPIECSRREALGWRLLRREEGFGRRVRGQEALERRGGWHSGGAMAERLQLLPIHESQMRTRPT